MGTLKYSAPFTAKMSKFGWRIRCVPKKNIQVCWVKMTIIVHNDRIGDVKSRTKLSYQ